MKKLVITMLSALMIVMMFAACGEDSAIKSATEASQGSTAAVATSATSATTKATDDDDSIDGGVVVDKEGAVDDGQNSGVE